MKTIVNDPIPHRNACPYCGHVASHVSAIGHNERPSKGAVSLCVKCGEWAIFKGNGRLRKPTDDEHYHIGMSQECRSVRTAWVRTKEELDKHDHGNHPKPQ